MIFVVTGANGFIGRHLCTTLAQRGHEVRSVVRADYTDNRVEKIISGADVVIHAAGATRAPTVAKLRASNVDLTRRVIAAAKNAGVRRFVFVSSQAAAGPSPALDQPTTEDESPAPVEQYGISKRDAEALVRDSGLSATIVRPAAVYGPGDRDFRAMFVLARRGIAIHAGNREQWVSIIHLRDCVDGIIRAATSDDAIGRTYFLANDDPVQWRTLFDLARSAASARRLFDVEIPLPLVRVGALFGDGAARISGHAGLLTSEKVRLSAPPFWVCSNQGARRELGFIPATPLDVGVAETYRWYLENGGL
ncbi:MAG TPA: NAD-dependent epimerase/dehydratase family protein [Gemmatimonadaceae bacterium]